MRFVVEDVGLIPGFSPFHSPWMCIGHLRSDDSWENVLDGEEYLFPSQHRWDRYQGESSRPVMFRDIEMA